MAHRHKDANNNYTTLTSAIVPVYHENPNTLRAALASLKNQVNQLIVVVDEPTKETVQIIKQYADEYIINQKKNGKRSALNQGLKKVKHAITILVDSDATLAVDAVAKIIQPFKDSTIGIVQGRTYIEDGSSKVSNILSKVTENSRDVMCRALNSNLIVADGRFQAIRTNIFQQIASQCTTDTHLGKKILTGDDRQRTRLVNKLKYKTVYQTNAYCSTPAQPSFKLFIKQQLRWNRSGYIYFNKDIKENNIPSKIYLIKSLHYYLGPFLYIAAIVLDILILPATATTALWYMTPILLLLGLTALTLLRHTLMFGIRRVEYKWLPIVGVYGLFIAMPLMIYALFTTSKACSSWETR